MADAGAALLLVYQKGGYKLLGYADQGFRVMSTNKELDASPTPMTFSEVYIGLRPGTIDAQENPYEVIVSNRLYEQQDYIVETNHLPPRIRCHRVRRGPRDRGSLLKVILYP